jgi:hypothetical protein
MTVGRSRLFTGVACVRLLVIFTVTILSADVAGGILAPTPQTPAVELLALLFFMVAITGIMLPFDIVDRLELWAMLPAD